MSGGRYEWVPHPACILVHDPRDHGRTWIDDAVEDRHDHREWVGERSSEPSRRFVFQPYDGTPEVDLTEYVRDVEHVPYEYTPGDTVQLWPVRAGNVQGYVLTRTEPYAEPMSAQWPEPSAADGQSQIIEPGDAPEIRTWVLDDGSESEIGPVERALREDLSRLKTTAHFGTTLLASATALAQAMDRAHPDKIASVGREFREHLKRIEDLSGDDDSTTQHTSNLSTPV